MSSLDDAVEGVFGFLENDLQVVESARASNYNPPPAPILLQEYDQNFEDYHYDFSTTDVSDKKYAIIFLIYLDLFRI